MSEPLTLRLMRKDEADRFFDLTDDAAWDPGPHDVELWWAADPEAFVAAELEGELIGGGALIAHDSSFGSLGHVVVRPERRASGLEDRLWQACVHLLQGRLGDGATLAVDGVSREKDRYRRAGFTFSRRTIRYETIGSSVAGSAGIVPAADVPFDRLAAFDRRCLAVARERFLRAWLQLDESLALAHLEDTVVRGYGVIRRTRLGARVEPLLADDVATAEALLDSLLRFAPDEPVFIDVPETNAWAMSLTRRRRMHQVSSRGRLYLGPAPRVAESRIFGDTSFELG